MLDPQLERPLVGEDPVDAWRRITGAGERVLSVERLKKNKRTRVYRLVLEGRPASIIAKRCREKVAVLERAVYTGVLDKGQLRAPAYYGFGVDQFTDDEHTYYWVFLEDLGPRRHDPANEDERRRLAHWLGALHALTAEATPSQFPGVPERRLAYYLAHLEQADRGLRALATDRPLPAPVRELIDGAVRSMGRVEANWPWLETLVGSTPPVIAHGDCLPKNAHVTIEEDVIPIDWGAVGIGFPGADLGVSSVWFGKECEVDPCVDAYLAAVRAAWTDANADIVTQLAHAGRTLWVIKLLAQSLPAFQSCARTKIESHLRLYAALLERSAGALLQ